MLEVNLESQSSSGKQSQQQAAPKAAFAGTEGHAAHSTQHARLVRSVTHRFLRNQLQLFIEVRVDRVDVAGKEPRLQQFIP